MARHSAGSSRQRARTAIGSGPVDRAHLARQTLGDPGLEQEVLRLFEEASRRYFVRIEHASDVPELLGHLHTLKAAAMGVGARALADLARTAEEEIRAGKPVAPERIEDLHMAVLECSAWIERFLARGG
jgi:HPt (histidine-containing phosphotransfer) domain-containing protein